VGGSTTRGDRGLVCVLIWRGELHCLSLAASPAQYRGTRKRSRAVWYFLTRPRIPARERPVLVEAAGVSTAGRAPTSSFDFKSASSQIRGKLWLASLET
jgi:hypothetical protein